MMEACQAIDVTEVVLDWIATTIYKWDDGISSEEFTNWAPGEPNNAGYNEIVRKCMLKMKNGMI